MDLHKDILIIDHYYFDSMICCVVLEAAHKFLRIFSFNCPVRWQQQLASQTAAA